LLEGRSNSEWNWTHIDLPVQEEALDQVTTELDKQGIKVARETIELRLQVAIKDLKASTVLSPKSSGQY
jgi:hypothetical protein